MSFGELVRFIDRALKRLSGPSAFGNEKLPRSEEELLNLCDMLSAKADALKQDAPNPMPERPTYDGPADLGWFTPSSELVALYDKRERYSRRVDDAIEGGSGKIYIEYVEREQEDVEREVAPLDRSERQEYDKRLRDYYSMFHRRWTGSW